MFLRIAKYLRESREPDTGTRLSWEPNTGTRRFASVAILVACGGMSILNLCTFSTQTVQPKLHDRIEMYDIGVRGGGGGGGTGNEVFKAVQQKLNDTKDMYDTGGTGDEVFEAVQQKLNDTKDMHDTGRTGNEVFEAVQQKLNDTKDMHDTGGMRTGDEVFEAVQQKVHHAKDIYNKSSSSKMPKDNDRAITISYQINPGAYPSIAGEALTPWTCGPKTFLYPNVGRESWKDHGLIEMPLPPEMRPFFNFTTSLQTNLKILIMGDSVGNQLALYIENLLRWGNTSFFPTPPVSIDQNFGAGKGAENVYVTAPLTPLLGNSTGGGALAFIRIIGMFLEQYESWAPANFNKGWYLWWTQTLREYVSNTTSLQKESQNTPRKKNITLHTHENTLNNFTVGSDESGNFDAFVFRIPSPGWNSMDVVTPETLRETVELAHELFGFRVVIFLSMHYVNDNEGEYVYSRDDMYRKNQELFDFARNWTETHGQDGTNSGVHSIYVLDYARLHDELLEWNARLLGFDTEHSDFTEDKIAVTLKDGKKLLKTVANFCGEKVPENATACIANAISQDGLHLCMNTVGPRLAAGLACQLQCAFPAADDGWACAQACNDRFMSTKGN